MTVSSKTLQIFLLFFLAMDTLLIAADNSVEGEQQNLPIEVKPKRKPPSLSLSLILQDPIDRMITELRTLSPTGEVDSWCSVIANYYWYERWNTQTMTLNQLKDKIVESGFSEDGIHMINRAIDRLIITGPNGFAGLKTPPSFNRSSIMPLPHVTWDYPEEEHSPQKPDRCPTPFAPLSSAFDKLLFESGENTPLQSNEFTESSPDLPPVLEIIVKQKPKPEYVATRVLSASTIKQQLQKFIAGQDEALASLSLIVHRMLCNGSLLDFGEKSASRPAHCILTGPSGCGKSETLRQLSIFAKIPVLHINAPCITAEGYKGLNFSEIVGNFSKTNRNPRSAIVVLEEIDKLGSRCPDDQKNFGTEIQKLLLSYLDGNAVTTSNGICEISNWLFIGTGAFSELTKKCKRERRSSVRKTTAVTHEDLKKVGFLPEFANRFKTIIPYKNHTKATMLEVLSKEGSPLEEIRGEFKKFYNVNLVFEPSVLDKLAEISLKVDTGVRALHTILGKILEPYYDLASTLIGTDLEGHDKQIKISLKEIEKSIDAFDVEEENEDAPPPGMYL